MSNYSLPIIGVKMSSTLRVSLGVITALLVAFMLLSVDSSLYGSFAGVLKLVGILILIFSVKIGRWIATL